MTNATRHRQLLLVALALVMGCGALGVAFARGGQPLLFVTHDSCVACHNNLTSSAGVDVSFGFDWRSSMMANAARDPYWQAAVRRETLDHPGAAKAIEDECSACHMPMARYQSKVAGRKGPLFAHLTAAGGARPMGQLAQDGVSCAACHQLSDKDLGAKRTFTGNFAVDTTREMGRRRIYGPFAVERGLSKVMRSASGFEPAKSVHVQRAELCASCHTLFTHARGPKGEDLGTLPEQVPYLEWKHSAYRDKQSCQDCHMPHVEGTVPVASVLGKPRANVSRHVFRGGNFFIPRLLNKHRGELGVVALPQELLATSRASAEHLETRSARLRIAKIARVGESLEAEIQLKNLAGHKLPTAYPSRRTWLQLSVRDAAGKLLFESGRLEANGSIVGNDNDADGARYEPHHAVIDSPDKVQIYEVIMVDHAGKVTTGLLRGLRYVKDNRVLPSGFDKASASADVAVRGAAADDADFTAASDTVRYRVPLAGAADGPLQLEATLRYQPIGYRWAENLGRYSAKEPRRFIRFYRGAAASSSVVLARAAASWQPPLLPAAAE